MVFEEKRVFAFEAIVRLATIALVNETAIAVAIINCSTSRASQWCKHWLRSKFSLCIEKRNDARHEWRNSTSTVLVTEQRIVTATIGGSHSSSAESTK